MTAKREITARDIQLCNDIAKADLSIKQIAEKHEMSASNVYMIARGDSRQELKPIIDEIVEAEQASAKRLARSRGRWFMARLVALANNAQDETALKAIIKGLEIAGLTAEEARHIEKQAIEIILSAAGNGDPLQRRLTGVYRPNNRVEPN